MSLKLPDNPHFVKRDRIEFKTEHETAHRLAQMFNKTPVEVKKLLVNCPFITAPGSAIRRYRIADAAGYLVEQKFDAEEFIAVMKRSQLPNAINKTFWDAMIQKQKWEENAGDLWRTDSIREKMKDMFQNMKFTMQLWVDSLSEQTKLTDDQREILTELVDGLQMEIYNSLVADAEVNSTPSTMGEVDYDANL